MNNPPHFNVKSSQAKLLPILKWPASTLHQQCVPVDCNNINQPIVDLMNDMFHTMAASHGLGLAAPQVGNIIQLITIDVSSLFDQQHKFVLINPTIICCSPNDLFGWQEGCLSVPGYFEDRKRPNKITVRYNDHTGVLQETHFSGIHSFVIQHEIDHLNGKVFVDGLSRFKHDRIKKKMAKTLKTI